MDGENGDEINSVNFNQDNGCFIVSTSTGIRVYNTHDFQYTFNRDFEGGIRMAEMLFRTNIIGFVGTGNNPSYSSKRLILWDDIQHRPFGELNFQTEVLNVKLRKDRVVVVLETKIYVYNFQNLECSDSYITCKNPLGLVSLSTKEDVCVLVIPDEKPGHVKIINFSRDKTVKQLKVHESAIACLKLSQDGSLLATASNKGTLIRVFNTGTQDMLCELRRGTVQAVITDITIDNTNSYVSCASDQGTIHVFKLDKNSTEQGPENKKSALAGLAGALSYFGSKWSFSQFRINDSSCKCAILDKRIFAISRQGNYFMGEIQNEGEIKIQKQIELLNENGDAPADAQ